MKFELADENDVIGGGIALVVDSNSGKMVDSSAKDNNVAAQ